MNLESYIHKKGTNKQNIKRHSKKYVTRTNRIPKKSSLNLRKEESR